MSLVSLPCIAVDLCKGRACMACTAMLVVADDQLEHKHAAATTENLKCSEWILAM